MKKTVQGAFFAGICLMSTACAGPSRQIYRVVGCDRRLADPMKREACRACVARPRPHVFFADYPEGTRCQPR